MTKFKAKSFLISTVIIALLILGLTNLDRIIGLFENSDGADEVVVIDQSDSLLPLLQEQLKPYSDELLLKPFDGSESDAEKRIKSGDFHGMLILSMNDNGLPEATYKANLVAEQRVPQQIEQALQQLQTLFVTETMGLDIGELEKLNAPVAFERIALTEGAKTEEELMHARAIIYILLFVIYFAVLLYGNMIAMEVATEKSSRVMEILISSAPPATQMFAKILGVALLGITQQLIFLAVGFFSLRQTIASQVDGGIIELFGFNDIPVATVVFAVIFFILGYLLFATIAAMLGSLVSRLEDVNQMITPLTLMIVAAFMIAMFGLSNPESTFITVTSYIPFFTPMIMFLRVGMLSLPAWEIALGIGLLIASIIVFAVIGAKVYRGGVLLYGKSASFKDLKKAFILGKKE